MYRFTKKKNFYFISLVLLTALVGTLGISEFNYSAGESHENVREPVSEPKKVGNEEYSPKIHPQIIKIMNHTQPEIKARSYGASFQNNELDVYVYLNPEFQNSPPKNLNILTQDGNIIFTRLTFDQIENISDLESVEGITIPINAVPRGHLVSEGVAWSFADDMHAAGFTGSGVTIAVIDGGFDSSNAEISGSIDFSSFQTGCGNLLCGDTAGDSHGTAVAEAVVDMAPDVSLRVYAILNTVGFNNAIDNAIANNADIITTSLAFIQAGGDGATGQYRDGTSTVAKKVNDAKNAGILVTAAVGNQGQSHWQGTYSASPVPPGNLGLGGHQSVMNFRPGESGDQRACLPVTDIGSVYLVTWDDWINTNQDYDLFLYNAALSAVLDFSADTQDGNDDPIEVIGAAGPFTPSTLCLVLASSSSTQNHFIQIDTEGNLVNDPNKVRAGSLDTPADATGALAVGAINQATDVLEAFSSSGPTDDSRNKPEICGPDNTLSHQTSGTPPLNPFFGTSSATPHVAGAAALLLEQSPSLTVDQLRSKLINEARFDTAYSVDNLCGSNSGALSLRGAAADCPTCRDFNNDGFDDLVIGVPFEDLSGTDEGAVNVIYGSAFGLHRSAGHNDQFWTQDSGGIAGSAGNNDDFSSSLGIGDFNGDTFDDLAIGVVGENSWGAVNVIYGSAFGLHQDSGNANQFWGQNSGGIVDTAENGDDFGSSLAIGDFNNDGFDDLAIGVPSESLSGSNEGAVNVIYGSASGLHRDLGHTDQFWTQDVGGIADTAEDNDNFGSSLAVGDFNDDGFDDLAIGVTGEDLSGSNEGAVTVIYGSANGLHKDLGHADQFWTQDTGGIADTAEDGDQFGWALTVGDFNNDGFDDLAIGVPFEDLSGGNDGVVTVIYGSANGLHKKLGHNDQLWSQDTGGIADTAENSDNFGRTLTIGDFNNDGFDDLAIGVPSESLSGTDEGAVTVIYGSAFGLHKRVGHNDQFWTQDTGGIADTAENFDNFGWALTVGDFNNDGFDDLVIGVPVESLSGGNEGVVNVIYGSGFGLHRSLGHTDQFWSQDSGGIADTAENSDCFGSILPGSNLVIAC